MPQSPATPFGHACARIALWTALVCMALSTLPSQAEARKPADTYKQKIALSHSPFPAKFKNDGEFVKYIKQIDTREFWPDTSDGGWRFHYMAFFAKPLNQSRYLVVFYDITDDTPIIVAQSTSYPAQRGMRIMVGDYDLDPETFKPNRKYLMIYTASVNDPAIAECEFVLRSFDAGKAQDIRDKRNEEARSQKARIDKLRAAEKKPTGPSNKFDIDGAEW